jgi:hypothetical protein
VAADYDVLGWSRWRNWSGERLSGDWVFEEPVSGTRAEPVNDSRLVGENRVRLYTTLLVGSRDPSDVPLRCVVCGRGPGQFSRLFTRMFIGTNRGLP